jgi:nucleotide-binding universal stress UspA family protein
MTSTILLCTDGSDIALAALRQALPVLAPATRTVVVTVTAPADPSLVSGTGFAGGVMTADEQDALLEREKAAAQQVLDETVAALQLDGAETMIRWADHAGDEICTLAAELPASVVALGTHGRSGIRRAVMGSTSDHVVRHAPCPVIVQGGG